MNLLLIVGTVLALAQTPAPSRAEQLQDAARKGDTAAVKTLLDEGVDVNTKFRYDATALFYACDHGHVELVKLLLDRGAAMNVKDTFYGFTPLMLALSPAQKKRPEHKEIAKLLIAKGSPGLETALSTAIEENDQELLKVVLDKGSIPASNLSDALEAAKAAKKTEMAAQLERAGAKPYEEFRIDPAALARFAGTYRNAAGNDVVFAVASERLTARFPGGREFTLVAKDDHTFRVIGLTGAGIAFQVTADKVTGVTLTPPQGNPVAFTRVEGK